MVDSNLLTKEKHQEIRKAVEELKCEEEAFCEVSWFCLEWGKLWETTITHDMIDDSRCLVCGSDMGYRCKLQPLYCWTCGIQGVGQEADLQFGWEQYQSKGTNNRQKKMQKTH